MTLSGASSISADSGFIFSAPEPGQLVEVRRRQWVVADVQASSPSGELSRPQHCLVLSSIDEDSLGEQIEVIWEIEPGAHIIEKAGLPTITGRDDSETLEAFLNAVRWGAATNADRGFLQAPFRSGVSIEDFQLDPLVRAIDMARTNLLIADDVGLGKLRRRSAREHRSPMSACGIPVIYGGQGERQVTGNRRDCLNVRNGAHLLTAL